VPAEPIQSRREIGEHEYTLDEHIVVRGVQRGVKRREEKRTEKRVK